MPKLENVIGDLNGLKDFACSDAANFPGNIKDGHRDRVLKKYKDLPDEQARYEAIANAGAQSVMGLGKSALARKQLVSKGYSQKQINWVAKNILQAKSGCCTTLAMTAANILTGGQRPWTVERIEIVAVPKVHLFVVVNRDGAAGSNGIIGDVASWGPKVTIVDAWLGTLGHDVIFTKTSYPFPNWLSGLEQHYDSTQPDPTA